MSGVPRADAHAQGIDIDLPASPYPGLRPFDSGEWMIFFGRESVIDQIIGRLVKTHLVALHGSSGSGKSSLVRAGVLPRLAQEHAANGLTWRTSVMVPGKDSLWRLANALAELHPDGACPETVTAIRRILNRGHEAAVELAPMLCRAPNENCCLLVDQFEELFELAKFDRDQAALFADILVGLSLSPPEGLYAIVTMRSDYLGACARFSGLAETVNQAQYLLPRMEHADLVRAIREPAELYGGEVRRDLAERLIAEARGDQDELPLIQHGLMLLWQVAKPNSPGVDGAVLSLDNYPQASNLASLLSSHADSVLKNVAPDETAQRTVELLFRALTDINAEGQAVRRRQTFADLCAMTQTTDDRLLLILNAFRSEGVSFLRPYGQCPIEASTEIDISHEALIRCWSRIADAKSGWLQQEFRDGLIWRSLIVAADSFERDATNVLGAVASDEREQWLTHHNAAWAKRYGAGWERVQTLMVASRAARDRLRAQEEESRLRDEEKRLLEQKVKAAELLGAEQTRRTVAERQRQNIAIAFAIVFLVLASLSGWLGWNEHTFRLEAQTAREDAEKAREKTEEEYRKVRELTASLLSQFGWVKQNQRTHDPNDQAALNQISESLAANRALQLLLPANDRARRKNTTVEYFPKDVDAVKIDSALRELGFTVKVSRPQNDDPTDSIWFGTPVDVNDAKLVALTLIRAGVQIRAIGPMRISIAKKKKSLAWIQVGAQPWVCHQPLTVKEIQEACNDKPKVCMIKGGLVARCPSSSG